MTVSLEQAQLKLAELITQSPPGETITIERRGKVVAELHVCKPRTKGGFGALKDKVLFYDADDQSHLADFKEYME